MKFVLFVIACLMAAVLAAPLTQEQRQFLFTKFIQNFDKKYEMNDFLKRFNIFNDNVDIIIAHNAKKSSFTMAINHFTDLSKEEFVSMLKLNTSPPKLAKTLPCGAKVQEFKPTTQEDKDIDWRTTGFVSPVENQGSCGSCWTFSAVAPFEIAYGQKIGKLTKFSEQQLIDCCNQEHGYDSEGCNGGLMPIAYDYYKEHGACLQSDYPYTGRDNTCKESQCTPVTKLNGYQFVNGDTIAAAAQIAPVAVALAASSSAFQFYSSGVVSGSSCKDRDLNHGVTVIAYNNKSEQYPAHYVIRNSWSSNWGSRGHISIERGINCFGVESSSDFNSIPLV